MRILFTTTSPTQMRRFESVVAELAERGHEVHIARHLPLSRRRDDQVSARLSAEHPGVTLGLVPEPAGVLQALALDLRAARDLVHFLGPEYNRSYRRRAERRVPEGLARRVAGPLERSRVLRRLAARVLDVLMEAIPADPGLCRHLRDGGYDVVLMTPYVWLRNPQPDLARAAHALGVPTVACVASWDNLTTKARIWPATDVVTVWNETQRTEAVELHGLDPATVAITGAQIFDQWFERRPRPREEFMARVGLPADRPMLLYACSSPFRDAPPEAPFVRRWIGELRASGHPELEGASILVRPHPKRGKQWSDADLTDLEHVAVWPAQGALVIDEEAAQDYFDSLFHSAALVGLNTSAMIEAAVVGRPVHSLLVPEFRGSQDGTFHFRYLVEVGGGLLQVAPDVATHHAELARSVAHDGEPNALAEGFVRAFVRPYGLDAAATPRFADVVEQAGAMDVVPRRAGAAGRVRDAVLRSAMRRGVAAYARIDLRVQRRRRHREALARRAGA